ncbi:MAG: IS1634 family transposase [Thermotogae bacterium]|nr:IS1634 family transposase [Thermotogota bacterium]
MSRGTQVINGTEYVFEDQPYWDSRKKRGAHKRIYIGKNVNGEFVPNKKYLLQQELEKAKKDIQPGPIPTDKSLRQFYGAVYLLEQIGEITGVTHDLKLCFPNSYKQMLSIVYYLILESNPLYRFKKWNHTHKHPYGKNISSQRGSELLTTISEAEKMKFFTLQAERRLETEFLAFDTTSISSYSQLIKQAKYGKNKDGDHLPQINFALLLGEESGLPVYYRKLPGNLSDVKTISKLLRDISFLNLDKVKLVMDRGFYSAENINGMYRNHYKFLIGAKLSLSIVKKKLDSIRDEIKTRKNYHTEVGLFAKGFLQEWPYKKIKPRSGKEINETRRIYIHYYYNDQKATDDRKCFYHKLDILEEELRCGKRKPEHEKEYSKYFEVTTTPVRGIKIEPKQGAIDTAEKNFGYFVLISNAIKDPIEALNIYRTKDLIEKAFENLKEHLNMRRESVASEEGLEGKLFLQFVALIYLCYIKKAMDDKKLFAKYSMKELLDELDIIEFYQQPGNRGYVGEITGKQKALYDAMKIQVPT